MRLYAAALALGLFIGPQAYAQELRYAVDERFAVIDEEAFGDLNVVFEEVPYDKLPPFIQTQMGQMAYKCTGDNENTYRMKAYSYVSDATRRQKLPPSYILDTLPLMNQKHKPCAYPVICADGLCSLIGFKAIEKDLWTRTFTLPVSAWSIKQRPYPGTTIPQSYFLTKTLDPECASNRGKALGEENQCSYQYLWTGDGLSMLPEIEQEQ